MPPQAGDLVRAAFRGDLPPAGAASGLSDRARVKVALATLANGLMFQRVWLDGVDDICLAHRQWVGAYVLKLRDRLSRPRFARVIGCSLLGELFEETLTAQAVRAAECAAAAKRSAAQVVSPSGRVKALGAALDAIQRRGGTCRAELRGLAPLAKLDTEGLGDDERALAAELIARVDALLLRSR
jgi:hypothetical protein